MSTLKRHPKAGHRIASVARIRVAVREEIGVDLSAAEVNRFVAMVRERGSLGELSDAMARMTEPLAPAVARAAQATENALKSIEDEFGLLTSTQVAQLLGSQAKGNAARSLANEKRQRGELLSIRRLNKFLYPGFQFDHARGQVKPFIKELLQLADEHDWESADVVLWLVSPTTYFENESRPVDHIDADPELVLDIAQRAWAIEW